MIHAHGLFGLHPSLCFWLLPGRLQQELLKGVREGYVAAGMFEMFREGLDSPPPDVGRQQAICVGVYLGMLDVVQRRRAEA